MPFGFVALIIVKVFLLFFRQVKVAAVVGVFISTPIVECIETKRFKIMKPVNRYFIIDIS